MLGGVDQWAEQDIPLWNMLQSLFCSERDKQQVSFIEMIVLVGRKQ